MPSVWLGEALGGQKEHTVPKENQGVPTSNYYISPQRPGDLKLIKEICVGR